MVFRNFIAVFTIAAKVRCMMTPEQCKAARGLLRMTQDDLAAKTGLTSVTIRKFENRTGPLRDATINLIKLTLESAGIEFIDENGGGPGVRLKG